MERCVALLRDVYPVDRYPAVWPAEPVRWLLGRECIAAWVAEDAGRLLGHLSLHRTDASRERWQWREALAIPLERLAVVSRFFVAPAARRRGVGSALLDGAEHHAGEHGLSLVLDVAEHNRGAIAFYEHRGWRRVGTTELTLSGEPWTLPLVLFVLPGS